MRWERLFAELEGHAEQAHVEERDALVADLREGEWSTRSWLDGLQQAGIVELDVVDVGVLSGRVVLANAVLIHLAGATTDHIVATGSVRAVRGALDRGELPSESVAARLGWGPILRELQADADPVRVTLSGAAFVEGTIGAVGADFVRVISATGSERDLPIRSLRMVTLVRDR